MARHAWWIVAIVLLAGCVPTPSDPKPRKPSTTTASKGSEDSEPGPKSSPAAPEKKPDPKPGQTFVPPEDKELAALKDVPTEELVTRLGNEKQRELATRALVKRGADAAGPLVQALEAENAQARAAAAFALGQLGKDGAEGTDALKKMAESDESEVARDAATFALDAIEGK